MILPRCVAQLAVVCVNGEKSSSNPRSELKLASLGKVTDINRGNFSVRENYIPDGSSAGPISSVVIYSSVVLQIIPVKLCLPP